MMFHLFVRHVYYIFFCKCGFYLTDFCYLSVYMMLYLINFAPNNETLLRLCFLSANGAMAVSVYLFKNSLALHRIDSLASLWIHLIPLIVTNHMRWKLAHREAFLPESERVFATIKEDITWAEWRTIMLYYPFLIYLAWSCFNGSIQFLFCAGYIERTKQNSLFKYFYNFEWSRTKLIRAGKLAGPLYMAVHLIFYAATHVLALLCFHYFWISFTVSFFMVTCAIWNGASYYMDYFAKVYEG